MHPGLLQHQHLLSAQFHDADVSDARTHSVVICGPCGSFRMEAGCAGGDT